MTMSRPKVLLYIANYIKTILVGRQQSVVAAIEGLE